MIRIFSIISIIVSLMMGCSYQGSTINKIQKENPRENDQLGMITTDEKTIISKAVFKDSNQVENTATLFYDEGIRLSVNKMQTVIDPFVSGESLSSTSSNIPRNTYTMKLLGEQSIIAVINHFDTVKGANVKLDLFKYVDQKIQTVFSSKDMLCEINDIEMEKGEVGISLPFANTTVTYTLTNQERERAEKIVSELIENQIKINNDYIESISENIICSPIEVVFADVDKNGREDVLLLTNIHTVGARTPVFINTNVVFIFEIKDHTIQYKGVNFGRGQESEISPFSYFQ